MMTIQQEIYWIIGIDLSKQTNTNNPQQINFVGKLEKDDGATMSFIAEKQQEKAEIQLYTLILSRMNIFLKKY